MKICKKRWIQSGLSVLCSFAIVLSVFPVSADNDISSLENQASALENELQGINDEIVSLSDQITSTQMQLEILNGDMERTASQLAEAEKNETQQYENMKDRIKYMYEHGNATLLEMLFSAEDMSDFLNKADFIENLSSYDRDALEELKAIHQEIEDNQETLKAQQASLTDLQTQLQNQQESLQAKAAETSTNLTDVQNRLEQARAEEARRIAEEEAERETVSENTDGGSVTGGGSVDASTDEITLLAALLQCEALQDYDCLLAVATVIMNRVESPRFANSISGVIYASGQFSPTWTGKLDKVLDKGPTSLSLRVAQDAVNGARLSSVADCYYFLYAPSTNRQGVVIGDNVFFQRW